MITRNKASAMPPTSWSTDQLPRTSAEHSPCAPPCGEPTLRNTHAARIKTRQLPVHPGDFCSDVERAEPHPGILNLLNEFDVVVMRIGCLCGGILSIVRIRLSFRDIRPQCFRSATFINA